MVGLSLLLLLRYYQLVLGGGYREDSTSGLRGHKSVVRVRRVLPQQ